MSINDPISDLIARITNAQMRRKNKVSTPGSRLRANVLDVLKDEGYIANYKLTEDGPKKSIRIYLKYTPNSLLRMRENKADAPTFMKKLVEVFGADHIAWGSNWPNSPGTLAEILAECRAPIADLPQAARDYVQFIEDFTKVPVSFVSVGPARDQTVVLPRER